MAQAAHTAMPRTPTNGAPIDQTPPPHACMRQDPFLGTHRIFIVVLAATFFTLLVWAYFAEIDIVATAQGKLEPVTFVRAIKVRDGETRAGPVVLTCLLYTSRCV